MGGNQPWQSAVGSVGLVLVKSGNHWRRIVESVHWKPLCKVSGKPDKLVVMEGDLCLRRCRFPEPDKRWLYLNILL